MVVAGKLGEQQAQYTNNGLGEICWKTEANLVQEVPPYPDFVLALSKDLDYYRKCKVEQVTSALVACCKTCALHVVLCTGLGISGSCLDDRVSIATQKRFNPCLKRFLVYRHSLVSCILTL